MTEQEFRDLIANDLVRIVTKDRKFHVVTTHATMCAFDVGAAHGVKAPLGWVRCWDIEQAEWHSIDPAAVFAYQPLQHFASEPLPLD